MKKIIVNPITKKDLTITSRSMRFAWGLFAYEAVLAFVFQIAMSMSGFSYGTGDINSDRLSRLVALFPSISIAQLCIVALIVPITTAASITGEKERQTFDIMLTTQISPLSIVTGKIMTSVIRIMMYVTASIPVMAVGFTIGGLSWWALFFYLILVLILAVFESSVGLFCSSVCKKSITSIVMSYIILAVVYGGSFIPFLIALFINEFLSTGVMTDTFGSQLSYSIGLLSVIGNPIITFIEFYTHILIGESFVVRSWADECLPVMELLGQGIVWVILSSVVIVLMSIAFVFLAAYKIDPIRGRREKSAGQGR